MLCTFPENLRYAFSSFHRQVQAFQSMQNVQEPCGMAGPRVILKTFVAYRAFLGLTIPSSDRNASNRRRDRGRQAF